jgi:hypothetical protein
MTSRETASELHYLRFRRTQIDAAIRALERVQDLRSTRSWKVGAIPTGGVLPSIRHTATSMMPFIAGETRLKGDRVGDLASTQSF